MGAMIEPPAGVPEMGPVLDAVAELDREVSGIIEHDLYPCPPEVPLPIARRTRTYLASCSGATLDLGDRR
jgi:inosose dehydratase